VDVDAKAGVGEEVNVGKAGSRGGAARTQPSRSAETKKPRDLERCGASVGRCRLVTGAVPHLVGECR
jgi:hypothetical protein